MRQTPIFLSKPGDKSTHPLIAQSLTIFMALGGFVFLGITLFMPVVRHFIAPEYWPGYICSPHFTLCQSLFRHCCQSGHLV